MKEIETIIKTHIIEEIFQTFPTLENTHPFDFFMSSDVDSTESVGASALGEEWNYSTCEEYGFENIKSLRGLMQSMLDDLLKLQTTISHSLKDDVIESDNRIHCELELSAFDLTRLGKDEIYNMAEEEFAKVGLILKIEEMELLPIRIEEEMVTYRAIPVDFNQTSNDGEV